MSSKSSTLVFGVILGVLIGVVGGYLYYDPKMTSLSTDITDMTDDLFDTGQELSDLLTDFSGLNNDYNNITNNYNQLQDDYNQLITEKEALETAYNELLDDYEVLVASLPLLPQQVSGTTLEKEYNWYYDGQYYEISLSIPESQYEYYKGLERTHQSDYSIYVTHPYDDEFINTIIRKFNLIALEKNLTEEEKINLVISFVQSLPYTVDSVTNSFDEYPRYPLETLVDNGGDCEDTSILTASLLKSMNYDVILINPPEHVAVGVNIDAYGSYWTYEGEKYYYLETTGEGWRIGDFPDDLGESAYLYPLNPIPMCVSDWVAEWNGRNKLDVIVTVTNLGSAMAEDYYVEACFDAGEDYIWNPEDSQIFDLNIGNSITFTLTLDVPDNEYTRLIVYVVDSEGYAVDTSYSEWFDT